MLQRLLSATVTLSLVLALATPEASGQRRDLSDVKADERGNGPITFNDDVIGYYFLYDVGKKGNLLIVTDADLEPIQRIEIEQKGLGRAVGGYFNGTAFCLLTRPGNGLRMLTFSTEGEPLGEHFLEGNTKIRERLFWFEGASMEGGTSLVTPVPGKGFACYDAGLKVGSTKYTLRYLPDDLDPDGGWVFESEKAKRIATRYPRTLLATPEYVVVRLLTIKSNGWHGNTIEVHRVSDGSLAFSYDPDERRGTIRIEEAFYDNASKTFVFAGTAFPAEADLYDGGGEGLAVARVGIDGGERSRKRYTWAQLASRLGPEASNHFGSGGSFHVHRVLPRPDGGLAFLGEAYLPASAFKRAKRDAGDDFTSYQNFAALTVDSAFELLDAQDFTGRRIDDHWSRRSTTMSPGLQHPSYFSYKDAYHYGQALPEGSGYVFSYYRYPDKTESSKELVIVTDYGDGDGAFEKVFRPSKGATDSRYVIAKPGFVLVNENFAGKDPTLRLEPVD